MNRIRSTRRLPLLLALLMSLAGCAPGPARDGDRPAEERLLVYTSFYPMYDFAGKIAGDAAQIVNLVPAGTEAHDWEPTAQDIAGLQRADVFVYSGAGMEHWVDSVLASVKREDLLVVETAREIALLETDEHNDHGHEEEDHGEESPDHGHYHEGADPHVWLSPANAGRQMEQIYLAMAERDPDNREIYRTNFELWTGELRALDREFREALEPLENRTIVVSHRAFGYLCADYGLTQVAAMDYAPEGEPDPARMAQLVDYARAHPVRTVFYEAAGSAKVAEAVAREIGAEISILYPLEFLEQDQVEAGEDYFSLMRKNLQALVQALQ